MQTGTPPGCTIFDPRVKKVSYEYTLSEVSVASKKVSYKLYRVSKSVIYILYSIRKYLIGSLSVLFEVWFRIHCLGASDPDAPSEYNVGGSCRSCEPPTAWTWQVIEIEAYNQTPQPTPFGYN